MKSSFKTLSFEALDVNSIKKTTLGKGVLVLHLTELGSGREKVVVALLDKANQTLEDVVKKMNTKGHDVEFAFTGSDAPGIAYIELAEDMLEKEPLVIFQSS